MSAFIRTARVRARFNELGKQVNKDALDEIDRHVEQVIEVAVSYARGFKRVKPEEIQFAAKGIRGLGR